MGFSGDIRTKGQEVLAQRRQDNDRAADARRDRLFAEHPEFRELYRERRASIAALNKARFQYGKESAEYQEATERATAAKNAWESSMASIGLPPSYLDAKCTCLACNDKGWVGTTMCHCLVDICTGLQTEALSKRLDIKGQSFETFDFRLYSRAVNPVAGTSPYEQMKTIRNICEQYAENFSPNSRVKNLLLTGQTGLGKTFLSTCIAGRVAEKGNSVVYDTAGSIFGAFETEQFDRRGEEGVEAQAHVRRCLVCDLLILDDLGCEMTTRFVTKVLYDIVNGRLEQGKHTVMSTNLSTADIGQRYSPAIASRISGGYMPLLFFGDDIRTLKSGYGYAAAASGM